MLRNITFMMIGADLFVLFFAVFVVSAIASSNSSKAMLSTDWQSIEEQVEQDIAENSYQFLAHAKEYRYSIPAISVNEYRSCLIRYAKLNFVKHDANFGPNAVNRDELSREYMFKYNQIVILKMLQDGVVC